MQNVLRSFVEYLFRKSEEIDETVIKRAELCKKDYYAVTVAGAKKNKDKWKNMLNSYPDGNASLLGYKKRVNSHTAAMINGFNAHSLELDDGHRFAMIHLGASVISAINACADDYEISDKNYYLGIIMGYEAACRVSMAMQPSHKQKGYHTAGTCGTIGAAVGVGFALRMGQAQMNRVVTLAAGSAAGMLEIQEQDSEVKPYNLGRAAMDGLMSAYIGKADFNTPDDMMGGERGFYHIFSETWDAGRLLEEKDYFEIQRAYFKPYASCRHSHSAVEAALAVRNKVDVEHIIKIDVETYRLGIKGHDHTDIKSVASAKLSTPYAVAAAILYGRADLSVFEPIDLAAAQLARKVKVAENISLTAQCPDKRIAILRVTLDDRKVVSECIQYAKGEPENPMSEKELEDKWESLKDW